jgi:erythromycin esterase-like protein
VAARVNETRSAEARVGFYGLDLYSLHASIDAVLAYLQRIDPAAAERARYRYGCLEDFGEDPQAYGYAATIGLSPSCEDDVVAQLLELRGRAAEYRPVTGGWPRTSTSLPSRTPGWSRDDVDLPETYPSGI